MTKRCYPGLYKWPDVKDYKIRTFHSNQLKSLKPKTCWLIIDLCTLLRWFYFYEKLFLEYLPILAPFSFYCKVVWNDFFVYGIAKRDLGISLLYFGSNTNSCTFYSIRIGMCVSKENYWTLLSNNIGAWFTFKVLFSLMCSIALTPIFNEIFQHST